MLCENPYYAVYNNGRREFLRGGNRKLNPTEDESMLYVWDNQKHWYAMKTLPVQRFPCRECLMCRWESSNEWSLRCKLEAKKFKNNQFVTLTYGAERSHGTMLTKKDFQRFIHNLREHFRRKHGLTGIRYFGCGEYGKTTLRPHYHLILFNCPPFGDEKFYKKDKAGFSLYKSKILEHLWGKGFCSIGGVSDKSIDYVARTRVKSYYVQLPKDFPEPFIAMSKQSGIGTQYLTEHFDEIVNDDGVMYDGKKYRIPRSFNRIIEKKLGTAEYKKRLTEPRQECVRYVIAQKAYENDIEPDDEILRYRQQIESQIKTLIKHDEETQV